MILQPVLSAKLYLILGCNIILHCQFPSTLDVTISLHPSSWMIFPTDTHTCSRCNFAVWSKLARLLQGDLHCFVCLQYLLPLLQNFPSSLFGELVLLPWQPASSSGGCPSWETISSSCLDHKIGAGHPRWGKMVPALLARRLSSVQFSCSVVSDSLWPHGLQHARPPCSSPTPRVYPNSCLLSWWCHPIISSSVIPLLLLPSIFPSIRVFSNESVAQKWTHDHSQFSHSFLWHFSNFSSGSKDFPCGWVGCGWELDTVSGNGPGFWRSCSERVKPTCSES